MGGLQYVELPNYAAILIRRTYTDLALEGALMDRSHDWLDDTDARWNAQDKRWEFPSGSTLTFGYLDGSNDWRRYDSAEFQYVGLDEASQFRPHDINAILGRLRRKAESRIPIRLRLGTNPGGESHDFLGERYVSPKEPNPERIFVPALLEDNPYVDRVEYEATLEALKDADPMLYRQRRFGHWVRDDGESIFKRDWFEDNRYDPADRYLFNRTVARWAALDTAETKGQTSAYSALAVGDLQPDYSMPLRYVTRERLEFPELIEWTIDEVAPFVRDGKLRGLLIENASSGRQLIQTLLSSGPTWLRPLIVPVKPLGKEETWRAASVWAKRGMVRLPEPSESVSWLAPFEEELFSLPNSQYKDQGDSVSMLVNHIENSSRAFSTRWRSMNRAT